MASSKSKLLDIFCLVRDSMMSSHLDLSTFFPSFLSSTGYRFSRDQGSRTWNESHTSFSELGWGLGTLSNTGSCTHTEWVGPGWGAGYWEGSFVLLLRQGMLDMGTPDQSEKRFRMLMCQSEDRGKQARLGHYKPNSLFQWSDLKALCTRMGWECLTRDLRFKINDNP